MKSSAPADGVYTDGGGGGVSLGASTANPGNIRSGVVSLLLLGESVGKFVDAKAIPGLTFGWGPENSGTIAFVDSDGRLFVMDQRKHKKPVNGVKDAMLPAWTADGTRLAYVQKTARKKYVMAWVPISK